MSLKTDIDTLVADAAILHAIVHGGSDSTVSTEGGAVKTVAKAVADAEAAIVIGADSYLDQCQAETALATAQALTATAQAAAASASAASAASVVSQDLSAIDRTVFGATIVDTFLYDTSKDSDGGAWRKRCAHTSWENETLSGNWLGSAANEAAARAISGATTGSYYYDTTLGHFYTLNAGSGKALTFRGNVRQFPAQVLITVEAARVVLWDITQANCPMWMVFLTGSGYPIDGSSCKGAAMLNGVLFVAANSGAGNSCLSELAFLHDACRLHQDASINQTRTYWDSSIAGRNTTGGSWLSGKKIHVGASLVSRYSNAVAMTVLPNAPVDQVTGLPVPTIAVATDAGCYIANNDLTVTSKTTGGYAADKVLWTKEKQLAVAFRTGSAYLWALYTDLATSSSITTMHNNSQWSVACDLLGNAAANPRLGAALGKGIAAASGSNLSLIVGTGNRQAANSMVAAITKDYNTGWMPGDIRGVWLADTVAETITGTELITNGDFSSGTTGWTAVNSGSIAVASGELTVTNGATNNGTAEQAITTVAGKTYTVTMTARVGTATPVYVVAATSSGAFDLGASSTTSATNTTVSLTFTATGTTTYIGLRNTSGSGLTGIYDNVSCRLADIDRSVKAKGLQVNGSITKAAVASGAALMGYSGFSAANFLEQPYNPDLDFGTGDFCIMGWFADSGASDRIPLYRGSYNTAGTFGVLHQFSSGRNGKYSLLTGLNTAFESTRAIADAGFHFLCWARTSGTLRLYIDGVLDTSGANSVNVSSAGGSLRIGNDAANSAPLTTGTVALVRISATAPTAEQVKHIYETEKKLFEANAQCCLAGSSNAVTALAYDEETDLLHVGTSYGRSAFKGLVRVSSEATPVGAITALAAGAGVIVQGGATAVDVYVPAYTLREELLRDAEQMAKFGQNLIAHDFTATASQTAFTLPVGWRIVAVYQQGALKRETTSWTRSFDGFRWTVTLGTGATVSDWISILATRV